MLHYITRLIAEGEHQQLDFKFEIADAHKIARTLVAFANTDGGRLLVGVKDDGTLAGVRSEEEYFMVGTAARKYCRPPVGFTVKEWNMKKKTILEVTIPRSSTRPHYAMQQEGKWVAYHRVKDQNFIVNRILMRVWKMEDATGGVILRFTGSEQFLLDYLEKNGTVTLSEFMQLTSISRNKAETIIVKFICLKILEMNFTENQTFFTLNPRAKLSENA